MSGIVKQSILAFVFLIGLTVNPFIKTSLITTNNVYAACTMTVDFAMVSSDGSNVLVFFNDSRASTYPPGTSFNGGVISQNGEFVTNIIINVNVSSTHSIARIPNTGQNTFNFDHTQRERNGDTSECGNHAVNIIPYDQSKDPYYNPPGTTFYHIIINDSNEYACEETTGPTDFTSLEECELAASNQPPIDLPGDGAPLGSGGDRAEGENPCDGGSCETALGSIPTSPKAFGETILKLGTGLGGGLAFILMVIGSIRVLMSSGDQQKLSGGRDMIVAAVAGLLFIIFSVLILEFIGVEIIGLGS